MRMRNVLSVVAFASVALLVFAGPGTADPNLVNAPPHQHWVITAQGEWIPVGPQVCPAGTYPQLQEAFNQFHFNIHHSALPSVGQIDTLGPQHGAPGLHDQTGADMTGAPCSFVAP